MNGSCTAQCKMLLFCAKTVVRNSRNIELPHLKKERGVNDSSAMQCCKCKYLSLLFMYSRHTPRLTSAKDPIEDRFLILYMVGGKRELNGIKM